MKKLLLKPVTMLLLSAALFSSCIDKDYDLGNISGDGSLKPVLGLPIGTLNYNIKEILKKAGIDESTLVITNDSIYIVYSDFLELESSNPVYLPGAISVPAASFPAGSGAMEYTLEENVPVNISGPESARVDSALLVNTELSLDINSLLDSDVEFELVLPASLEAENPSDLVFTLPPGNTVKQIKVKDYSLLKMNSHLIQIVYKIRKDETFSLNASDVTVGFEVVSLETDVLWGFFGDVSFDEKNNKAIYLKVFDDVFPSGSKLLFSNPIVSCDVRNYVGMDATFNVDHIKAIDKNGVDEVYADFNGSSTYDFVLQTAPKPHQYSQQKVIFDKNNGGTNQLFIIEPEYIDYKFTSNPLTNQGQNVHFLVRNKFVDVAVDIKLPLSFNEGTYLTHTDTLELDLSGDGLIENIEELILGINYENRLPVNSELSLVFLDENERPIANISRDYLIKAAVVEGGGTHATEPTTGRFSVKFTEQEWDDAGNTRYLVIKNRTSTIDQEINLHPEDYINLKFDVYTKANVEF